MKPARIPLSRKIDIASCMFSSPGDPRVASLFVTRHCNLRCPYCRSIEQPTRDIPHEEWKRIIDRLYDFGVRLFTFTGGEPTIRPDCDDLVEYIVKAKNAVCWLITNGSALTHARIGKFGRRGLQFLTVSLDSLSDRGFKNDRSVLEILDYARTWRIICSTLTVITRDNIDHIATIARTVARHKIIFDMGLYMHVGGIFSPPGDSMKADLHKVRKTLDMLKRRKLLTGLVSPSWSYLSENLRHYRDLSWKCSPNKDYYLIVNNDGTLMTCQEYGSNIPVLSINSLKDPRWREYKNETVSKCRGCFYGCYYQFENKRFLDALFDAWVLLRA